MWPGPPFPGLPASETLLHPLLPAHPSTSRRGQRRPRRLLCSRSCLCPRRSRLLSQGDSGHCHRLPPSHPVSQQPLSCSARAQSSLLSDPFARGRPLPLVNSCLHGGLHPPRGSLTISSAGTAPAGSPQCPHLSSTCPPRDPKMWIGLLPTKPTPNPSLDEATLAQGDPTLPLLSQRLPAVNPPPPAP